MKKTILTIAIALGMAFAGLAQQTNGGGLFQRGAVSDETYYGYGGYAYNNRTGGLMPMFPSHDETENQDATPLGSGIAVLLGLGGAYLVAKKCREE